MSPGSYIVGETTIRRHCTFRWTEPYRIEVTINLHDYDTDESIKEEIRRQLSTE